MLYPTPVRAAHRRSADRIRAGLSSAAATPARFRAALTRVPPSERDAWLDRILALEGIPADGPELPRGCVPYLPCPVDALLRMVDQAGVRASDVFVDLGSGVGRAAALVHLLTGAPAIGIEIQPALVRAARDLTTRLSALRFSPVEGDASRLAGFIGVGSVFFLYCPFSGTRLENVLKDLELIARTREIRVCTVDLPLPPRPWLTPATPPSDDLAVYRSTLLDGSRWGVPTSVATPPRSP
jgi:SAM-dependent methyltransferase